MSASAVPAARYGPSASCVDLPNCQGGMLANESGQMSGQNISNPATSDTYHHNNNNAFPNPPAPYSPGYTAELAGRSAHHQWQQRQLRQQQPGGRGAMVPLPAAGGISTVQYRHAGPAGQQTLLNNEKPKTSGPSFVPTVPTLPNFYSASQNLASTVPNLSRAQTTSPPSQHVSSYANQQRQQQPRTLNAHQPMAAPIIPQDLDASQPIPSSRTGSDLRPPATESYITRERKRIALLLDLNRELLWDLKTRQENGEAGSLPAFADQEDGEQKNVKLEKQPSHEYIEIQRRLQANFSYLMANYEATIKPNVTSYEGPAFMTPPTYNPKYFEYYAKLHDLFPGWQGVKFGAPESGISGDETELQDSTSVDQLEGLLGERSA